MSNQYFQFKQFTIYQDQCAMKVCTDACILGAWFAAKLGNDLKVLDLGTGTGLLMLMLAQKSISEIHGIELDPGAYNQLKSNTSQSKWKDRLKVFFGDARTYPLPVTYDFIITNPPFFENDLPSESKTEQLAKHSSMLSFEELIKVINANLSLQGFFGILLPYHRWEEFDELASGQNFHLTEKLFISHSKKHAPFRVTLTYNRIKSGSTESALIIKQEDGLYTPEFKELMKDYYLYL